MEPELAFGLALRQLRKDCNLSQETLAFESGLQRNFISMLELGQRSPAIKTLFKLAPPLNTTPSQMMMLTQWQLQHGK